MRRSVVRIGNAKTLQTDCELWAIWTRVAGAEIFSGTADAVDDGVSCNWEFTYFADTPGDDEVDVTIFHVQRQGTSTKFPEEDCQRRAVECSRTPNCRYWATLPLSFDLPQKIIQLQPPGGHEEMYWVTGSSYSSKREPVVTLRRAEQQLNAMLEQRRPKGYRGLEAYDTTAAFLNHGLHIIGPPAKMVITKLFHYMRVYLGKQPSALGARSNHEATAECYGNESPAGREDFVCFETRCTEEQHGASTPKGAPRELLVPCEDAALGKT